MSSPVIKYRPCFSGEDYAWILAQLRELPLEKKREKPVLLNYMETFAMKITLELVSPAFAVINPTSSLSMADKYVQGLLSPAEEAAYQNLLMGISE